ncbi:hypothetical protein [Polaribacter sp.]|uniref:hypothetical protein n=1 Tax=Polaribacter sp. TaxID=1920175 RepID=UPI0025F46F52|nr:hypothetical protein [Polaribacter sp.]
MTNDIKVMLKDAMKVDELVIQLNEVDKECGFHDGSFEGMLGYYTKDIIIAEAKNRLDMANENLGLDSMFGMSPEDDMYSIHMKEKRQLERFIKKWKNKENA